MMALEHVGALEEAHRKLAELEAIATSPKKKQWGLSLGVSKGKGPGTRQGKPGNNRLWWWRALTSGALAAIYTLDGGNFAPF